MRELDLNSLSGAVAPTDAMALSPDGRMLACATKDQQLVIWDLAARQIIARYPRESELLLWTAAGLIFGRLHGYDVVDPATGDVVTSWEDDLGWVRSAVECGDSLFLAGAEHVVRVRDHVTVATFGPWPSERDWPLTVRQLAVSERLAVLAVLADDVTLMLNFEGETVAVLDEVDALVFGDDEHFIVCAGGEGEVRRWPSNERVGPLTHRFSAGQMVAGAWLTWDSDSVMRYAVGGEELWSSRFYDGVCGVAAAGGERFYTAPEVQWIGVRDLESGSLIHVLPAGGGARVNAMCFDETGDRLVVADRSGRVVVWDVADGCPESVIDSSSFQPDGAPLDIGALRHVGNIHVIDGQLILNGNGVMLWPDIGAIDNVTAPKRLELNVRSTWRHGAFAVVDDWDADEAHLVSLPDGTVRAVLPPHEQYDEAVEISASGERALFVDTRGEGTTLRLWSIAQGFEAELHISSPNAQAKFSPDGDIVGWASTEWDDETEDECDVFFRWDGTDVTRWFEGREVDGPREVHFVDGHELFVCYGDVWQRHAGELRKLHLPGDTTTVAVSAGQNRCAIATDHGVVVVIDLATGVGQLLCTTSDGGTWTMPDWRAW